VLLRDEQLKTKGTDEVFPRPGRRDSDPDYSNRDLGKLYTYTASADWYSEPGSATHPFSEEA
jgi:hypothetical protein